MTVSPRYWLVNSGTSEDPWRDDLVRLYERWNKTEGSVQGFSRRPGIRVGDVLLHRAVASEGNRLVAVAEVVGQPRDRATERWRWRLPRQLLYVCPTLDVAPTALSLGIEAYRMRTYKQLDARVGERAARAIADAGVRFGS
jgi:hypothetical protein